MDFSNNKINLWDVTNNNGIPVLKVLDMTNNNYPISEKFDYYLNKKIAFFAFKNNSLFKGKAFDNYLLYLKEILPNLNYPLKTFNLNGLFYKCEPSGRKQRLASMQISKFKNSLIEIDLSFCKLTNKELVNILYELILTKLRKINLSNNQLNDELFSDMIKNKIYDIYNSLKIINLSNNSFYLKDNQKIQDFVKAFDNIKSIILYNTPAEDLINKFIKKSIIKLNENEKGIEFDKDDQLIKGLLDKKDLFNNNNNIKLRIKNTIDFKFIDAANKIFPDLMNKIIIDYKSNTYDGPN
jgi:hypothetical protein